MVAKQGKTAYFSDILLLKGFELNYSIEVRDSRVEVSVELFCDIWYFRKSSTFQYID